MSDSRILKHRALAALFATAALASGCGDGGSTPPPAPAPTPAPTAAQACAALGTAAVAAGDISLATTGATVTSATLVAASGTGATALGEYCDVKGSIGPVDRSAPPILFRVSLPTTWNAKAVQVTGGGYDGSIPDTAGPAIGGSGYTGPLARGYAAFASDSGHEGSSGEASFGMNDEALENYFGDQLRKTRDVAVQLMKLRYGAGPARTYAEGGSGGGREALYTANRWPDVYDGVIAYFPAWSLTAMILNYGRIAKALAAPGAWIDPAKQQLVADASTSACDALDGVADGLVSHVDACTFTPATLRCPGGADAGDTCLSDAQIAGVSSYAQALSLGFPLADAKNSYPGYNVFSGAAALDGALSAAGTAAPATPSTFSMPFAFYIYEPFVRYWVTRDANYDSLTFDATANGYFQQRLQYISSRLDVHPDFSAFLAKGGKILILHGDADSIIPTRTSEDLVGQMTTSMGADKMAAAVRFYEVPGYGHGLGAFLVSWDSLGALEDWVEKGTAPTNQVVTDANPANGGRTRPLCEFPSWPKYAGTGDVNAAASYSCAPQ